MRWIESTSSDFYRGGQPIVEWYNDEITSRRQKIPGWKTSTTAESDIIAASIHAKGHHKVESFWDLKTLDNVRSETMHLFESNNPEIVKPTHGGQHTQINHPLLALESLNSLAIDDRIVAIATSFFKCYPGLGTQNMRYSNSINSRPFGTCQYHMDFNSPVRILKFFVYLNNVTMDNGPFTYTEGSNLRKPDHWQHKLRWEDEEIEDLYGKAATKNLTANYGDLIMATTNGYHKGLPLKSGDRTMFTINFVVHPELGQTKNPLMMAPFSKRFKVSKEFYEQLSDEKKPLYDFMEKV